MNKKPYILTIAGFDSSGGAGLLADVKTFEQHKCVSMGVQTANTIQTEDEFIAVNWISEEIILQQLDTLLDRYTFRYIKVGLVPNLELLLAILKKCKAKKPNVKIIWDPILVSSTGFDFKHELKNLEAILQLTYLITPNWNEVQKLTNNSDAKEGAKALSKFTQVLLKGGHNESDKGKDYLFENEEATSFNPQKIAKSIYPKHGSGCVLSASITANLNHGYTLHKSILKSKRYIEHFLASDKGLLGRHKI